MQAQPVLIRNTNNSRKNRKQTSSRKQVYNTIYMEHEWIVQSIDRVANVTTTALKTMRMSKHH
jgi:hypothetical protein